MSVVVVQVDQQLLIETLTGERTQRTLDLRQWRVVRDDADPDYLRLLTMRLRPIRRAIACHASLPRRSTATSRAVAK
jgi:hypothetical protein